MRCDILRRLRFDARSAEEAEISEPVDETVLPRAERRSVASLQAIAVHPVPVDVSSTLGTRAFSIALKNSSAQTA